MPDLELISWEHAADIPIEQLRIYEDGELIFNGSDPDGPNGYITCHTTEDIRRALTVPRVR